MSEESNVIINDELQEEREIVFEEALEAILFAAGHPISYSTLGRVLNMTPSAVKERVLKYAVQYNESPLPRGVVLLTFKDTCQLCTKQYYLHEIRDALGIKKSGTLSSSALEVLAIVAYNQPVTRAFVDTLRRVDSSYAMNNLIDRGLIVSTGRLDVPGRPMLYGTTSDFLRCFGMSDLSDLPATSDELISAFNNAKGNTEDQQLEGQISADIESAIVNEDATNDSSNDTDEKVIAQTDIDPSAEDDIHNVD